MGQRDEIARLAAHLDEWAGASVGVRRRPEQNIAAQLGAMDPGSVPPGAVERLASRKPPGSVEAERADLRLSRKRCGPRRARRRS
jgi:hypothetical protein